MSHRQFSRAFPGESNHIEFKSGTSGRAICATAVAFSNADGGVILVGVDDDGQVRGRALDAGTADALHTALGGASDLGRYQLHALDVDGMALTLVSVARREQGFAQTENGRVLVRKGTQDMPAFGAELQRLVNSRSATRYEATPLGAAIADVPPDVVREFTTVYGWTGPAIDVADLLTSIGLAEGQTLTVAGALHLLPDPAVHLGKAFVEVLRFADDATSDYDRRDELRGPLGRQVRDTVSHITNHLGTELIVLGMRRYELPRVPEVVLRECVVNAVAHRSYEASGAAVRVELRPGFVRVTSPGGLPEPVTVENIRATSAARNLAVIRVLRQMGLAEDAGRGIDVMQDAMRDEMLDPPDFRDTGKTVVVTLPLRSAVAPEERAWIRELEARGEVGGVDRLVLVHAARGEALTNRVVRDILGVDAAEARDILVRLRDRGILEQSGQRGGTRYRLADGLRPPAGLRLDPDDLATLVEQQANDGPIQNADVRRVTGLGRVESLEILRRLVDEGRLVRTGERRGARYARPPGTPPSP